MPKKRPKKAPAASVGEVLASGSALLTVQSDAVARYLAETGLSLKASGKALYLEDFPTLTHAPERLTAAEMRAYGNFSAQLFAVEAWAYGMRIDPSGREGPQLPDGFPAADAEAILATVAALPPLAARTDKRAPLEERKIFFRGIEDDRRETLKRVRDASPAYRDALERREALAAKMRLSPDELRAAVAELLTRPDGTLAPSPAEWCAARGESLEHFRDALNLAYGAQLAREQIKRERTEWALVSPPLRVGSRTAKTYSLQRGAPWRDTLKRLKKANALSKHELQALEKDEPVPLKGDELLAVAGLLELARREPGFRAFGPTNARIGNYALEARFLVPKPRLEEFCRLLGYEPTKSGTVSGGDRGKVLRALEALSKTSRPIVVRQYVRNGKQWEEAFLVARDLPVRDEGEHYALHASLFDGYFHGHLTFDRAPQQWDAARRAIGRRNITDEMKWGDVYFRRLALGVLAQTRREFLAKRIPELSGDGLPDRVARRRAGAEWREHKPATMTKELRTETLLAELDLTEWRDKRGPVATREALETVLEFAQAVEGCPVVSWKWTGTGKLPAKLAVTLETPDADSDPEDGIEQGELFAAIGPGDSTTEAAE